MSLYEDDGAWTDDVLKPELLRGYEAIVDSLARFAGFHSVEVVHGTRLQDPSVIHREGLRVASWEGRRLLLESTIKALDLPDTVAARQRANLQAASTINDFDIGRLYTMLDSRVLVEQCGHYLLWGREWTTSRMPQYRSRFRSLGFPTVFVVNLPVTFLSPGDRRELAEKLLHEWTRLTILRRTKARALEFAFILRQDIPAKYIIRHFHPPRIFDVHSGCKMVRNSLTACPACFVQTMPT